MFWAIPPLVRQSAEREVGVTSTDPETSGQVGGGLCALSILAAAHFPPPAGSSGHDEQLGRKH